MSKNTENPKNAKTENKTQTRQKKWPKRAKHRKN